MQLLVLLGDSADLEALGARIVHSLSERLVVVEADSAAQFAQHPGVLAVTDRSLPDDPGMRLTESEAIFAAAFAARVDKPERVGEGLPWDASGFEPPNGLDEIDGVSRDAPSDEKGEGDV